MIKDPLIWQLADSAFPSGGFAHSGGLEAAVQLGAVSDAHSLELFLQSAVAQIDRGVASFARACWDQPSEFRGIDHNCDLFLNNHVANRASRAQGQAMLASAASAFAQATQDDSISRWALVTRRERLAGHLAPVFGLVARALGISSRQMSDLFLFINLRGSISAAVRLGCVGPMQAQQIQSRLALKLPEPPVGSPQHARQINPLLDLMQMTQDRLYSRLFQS